MQTRCCALFAQGDNSAFSRSAQYVCVLSVARRLGWLGLERHKPPVLGAAVAVLGAGRGVAFVDGCDGAPALVGKGGIKKIHRFRDGSLGLCGKEKKRFQNTIRRADTINETKPALAQQGIGLTEGNPLGRTSKQGGNGGAQGNDKRRKAEGAQKRTKHLRPATLLHRKKCVLGR